MIRERGWKLPVMNLSNNMDYAETYTFTGTYVPEFQYDRTNTKKLISGKVIIIKEDFYYEKEIFPVCRHHGAFQYAGDNAGFSR